MRTLENLEAIFGADSDNSRTNLNIERYRRQQKKLVLIVLSFFLLFITGAGCIIGLTPHKAVDLCNTKILATTTTNLSTANITHSLLDCHNHE